MPQSPLHRAVHALERQAAPSRGLHGLCWRVPVLACVMAALLVCAHGLWPAADSGGMTGVAWAKSASNARDSGLEPPGGPKPMEGLPGKNVSRTSEGGMGYTDAYGNTITDTPPEEKAPRRRPGPGAYGNRGVQEHDRPLPDPTPKDTTPAWNFN